MALGNTSVSSLVNGARAARVRQTAANDQAAGYEYSTSLQTQDDYNAYKSYLDGRLATTTDPSKQISLKSTQNAAYSSFTGNESQRQSTAVIEGGSSNRDKYAKLMQLYNNAPTAAIQQNLYSQLVSLSRTIQTEDRASAAAAVTQSTKGMNSALNMQDIALKTISKFAGTGKPLQDETGTNLVLNPDGTFRAANAGENGSVVTARNAAMAQAVYYANKDNILSQAIASGMDTTGSILKEQLSMQNTDNYKTFTNGTLIGALQSGDNAFTNKLDEWGKGSSKQRKLINWDASGHPVFANGFLDNSGQPNTSTSAGLSSNPGTVDVGFNRKAGTSKDAPMDNYTTPSYMLSADAKDAEGNPIAGYNRTIVDPVTGKGAYVGITPLREGNGPGGILSPGIPGSIPQTAEDLRAGRKVGFKQVMQAYNPLEAFTNNSQYLNDVSSALGAVGNAANKALAWQPQQLARQLSDSVFNRQTSRIQAENLARQQVAQQQLAKIQAIPVPNQTSAARPYVAPPVALQKPQVQQAAQFAAAPLLPTALNLVMRTNQAKPAPQNKKVWWQPSSWFK